MNKFKNVVLYFLICCLISIVPCTGVKAALVYSYNIAARELSPTKYPLDNSFLNVPIRGGSSVAGTFEFEYNISGYEKFIDVYHEYSFGLSLDDVPRFIFDTQVNLPVGDVVTTTSMYLVCNGVEYPFSKNNGNNWSVVLSDGVFNSASLKFKVDYLATYGGADTDVFYMSNPRLVVSNGTLYIYDSSTLTDQGEVNSFRSRMEEMIGALSSSIGRLNSDLSASLDVLRQRMVDQINKTQGVINIVTTKGNAIIESLGALQTSMESKIDTFRTEFDSWMSSLYTHIKSQFTELKTHITSQADRLVSWLDTLNKNVTAQFTALFEKMDEQQNELINGYDPATGDNANTEFENTVDDLAGTEGNLFEISQSDFKFEESDLLSDAGLVAAASFVGNYMQAIFEASGIFGEIAIVGLVLLVFTRLIGFQNFSSGGG